MTKKFWTKILNKENINIGFALVSFLLAIYLSWSLELALALALSVYFFLGDFKPDFYKKVTIIFAVLSTMVLAINEHSISEGLAVVAFLALVVYLILELLTAWRNG